MMVAMSRLEANVVRGPSKSTLLSLALVAVWATSAQAGIILSTDQMVDQRLDGCSSMAVQGQQPAEDSSDKTLLSSERCGDMASWPSLGAGPEIPSAVHTAEWHSAACAQGEPVTLSLDLKLPAPIPIELLKIPISMAAMHGCSCS